jgi:hypothetical protein
MPACLSCKPLDICRREGLRLLRAGGKRQKEEGRGQKEEGRGQKEEGRGQRAEGGRQRAEGGGERAGGGDQAFNSSPALRPIFDFCLLGDDDLNGSLQRYK